ncbi:MAG: UDP-N-acetylmuramate dehydrogenase [Marinilabiliales bacterium]|nr:UDP-N-acetylmuramate dehydrogenase [Marinilabiliales bacterium]
MYKLVPNHSLRGHQTFGLDVRTDYWLTIGVPADWQEAMQRYPHLSEEKRLIIGGGSNLLFLDDFDGLILSPDISGMEVIREDGDEVDIRVGAGEEWDNFVAYAVSKGWYGVENLSLIPGRVGAVPVQNIGAYGVEVSSLICQVEVANLATGDTSVYDNGQCEFGYRNSLFKQLSDNRLLIVSVVFRLKKQGQLNLGYGALERQLGDQTNLTPADVRSAVLSIRRSKLPDPAQLGNAGSFFKNPTLPQEEAEALADQIPGLPIFPNGRGQARIAAGFLIDQAGWKGRRHGKAAVHDKQALVLVNLGGATGREIYELSQSIQQDILERYGIRLEREVLVIGD